MEKPLYNQGDLLQYRRVNWGARYLFVITDVFEEDGETFYKTLWIEGGERNAPSIKHLDNDEFITLVARGQ